MYIDPTTKSSVDQLQTAFKGKQSKFEMILREARFLHSKRHNTKGYSAQAIPNRKYQKQKMQLLGNKGAIYGCLDDDYNSCDAIQNVLDRQQPKALVLGDICSGNMPFYRLGELKYMSKPVIEKVRAEHIMGRKKLTKFFQEQVDLSQVIHFEADKLVHMQEQVDPESNHDHTVYQSDQTLKRKIGLP